MCRILILSVTAGEGHNSTARAMKAYFDSVGAECRILDAYECVSHPVKKFIDRGYLFAASRMKTGFGIGYRMAEHRHGGADRKTLARLIHTGYAKKLLAEIEAFRPDAVVTTHCFAGLMLDIIRRRGWDKSFRLVGVVTDFTVHPYWDECWSLDALVVASPRLVDMAQARGFDASKVFGLGIPIDAKFAIEGDRRTARASLGLGEDANTLLVMGGSMGHGHFAQTVQRIDELDLDLQIVCVCGRNARAGEKLGEIAKTSRHRILPLGFVGYIDRLMDAADLMVSKPGGLSTSEALAKRLPMIVTDPIPGHEKRNREFLVSCGAALQSDGGREVAGLVQDFFTKEGLRESLLAAIEELRRPDSARDVCELVLGLCAADGGKNNN